MVSQERRLAIISAGASGIGRAMAEAFDAAGYTVWVGDRDAAALAACPTTWQRHTVDITQEDQVAAWLNELRDDLAAQGGQLAAVCANAGIAGPTAKVEDVALVDWNACLDVNLSGAFLLVKHTAPILKTQGAGAITLTSSTAGLYGYPNRAPYCAAKWAVIGLMKTLAMELGPHGIRANAICPGTVDTPMIRGYVQRYFADDIEGTIAQLHERQPVGRMGEASEIAALAVFLAADESAFMTGSALPIDGGWTAK